MRYILLLISLTMVLMSCTQAPQTITVVKTEVVEVSEKCILAEPKETKSVTTYEDKVQKPNPKDCIILARLIWGEGGSLCKMEKAAIVWCVCNRVDCGMGNTVEEVVTAYGQFSGYHEYAPVYEDNYDIAYDVLQRWYYEQIGVENVGRVLPKEYIAFRGFRWKEKAAEFGLKKNQSHNWYFLIEDYYLEKYEKEYWDWSLPNPYKK